MLVAAVKKSRKDQTYAASAATGSAAAAGARARSVSTATHCWWCLRWRFGVWEECYGGWWDWKSRRKLENVYEVVVEVMRRSGSRGRSRYLYKHTYLWLRDFCVVVGWSGLWQEGQWKVEGPFGPCVNCAESWIRQQVELGVWSSRVREHESFVLCWPTWRILTYKIARETW